MRIGQAPRRRRAPAWCILRTLDAVGLLLWAGLTGWVMWAARAPQDARSMRNLLVSVAIMHVAARLVSRRDVIAVPLLIMLAGASVAAVWLLQSVINLRLAQLPYVGDVLLWLLIHVPATGAALLWWRDPLGYANATAALTLVAAAAALVVAARTSGGLHRVALAAAVLCAVAPAAHDALTSAALATALIALFAESAGRPPAALVTRVSAAVIVAVLCVTAVIGAAYNGKGTPDAVVGGTLSGNRALLWGDALDQVAVAPLTGVGTNRFSQVSPIGRADPDLRWAHQELLQLAAETGLPGLALGLALALWVLARLAAGPRDGGTAFVVAGFAAVCVAAQIDYVWHFPAVTLATAALSGCGGEAVTRGSITSTVG